jgi:hypothetical protein
MKICQSCGMTMQKYNDFGGGDMNNIYCSFCTDRAGNLKPREEVKTQMSKMYLKQGLCPEEAARRAEQNMREAPAWKVKK